MVFQLPQSVNNFHEILIQQSSIEVFTIYFFDYKNIFIEHTHFFRADFYFYNFQFLTLLCKKFAQMYGMIFISILGLHENRTST